MIDLVKSEQELNGNDSKGFSWLIKYGAFMGVLLALAVQTVSFIWFIADLRHDIDSKADRELVSLIRQDLNYIKLQLVDSNQFSTALSDIAALKQQGLAMQARLELLNTGGSRALQVLSEQVKTQAANQNALSQTLKDIKIKHDEYRETLIEHTVTIRNLLNAIVPHLSLKEFEQNRREDRK